MESTPNNNKELICYPVAFKLLKPDNIRIMPTRIDGGMYYLKAPYRISQDTRGMRTISMGIEIKIPECFEVFTNKPGVTIPMILHAHIDSLYDVLVDKGIEIVAPRILSPSYTQTELKLTIRNIGQHVANIERGEPIACLYFTATPPIIFGENNNI